MKKILAIFTLSILIFYACKKNDLNVTSNNNDVSTIPVKVYISDGPIRLDTVNLDIKVVELKIDTSKAHKMDDHFGDKDKDSLNNGKHKDDFGYWDTLSFTPAVYNIAALRNGIEQSVASGNIANGAIRKLRITLGTNNTIVQNGVTYPLTIASNYIYASFNNAHKQKDSVHAATTALRIDFDLFRGIALVNGKYVFTPYLKPFNDSTFGTLTGVVTPANIRPLITVFNSTDTLYGLTEKPGFYKMRGIKPGTYSVKYSATGGYVDTTLLNIVLTAGKETRIPNVVLHK